MASETREHAQAIEQAQTRERELNQYYEKRANEIDPERSAVAIVDAATEETRSDFAGYAGVATVALTADQQKELMLELPDEAHDILPTGEVYVQQVHYRRKLNSVFGPAGWALVPRSSFAMQGNTITREYALVGPGGRFISEAIGESEYQPNNARMSYASACEACKSNALTRCCKDLGIASECWDRRWCDKWIAANAVKVWRNGVKNPQWRRKDAAPWWDEKGAAEPQPPRTQPVTVQKNGQAHVEQREVGDDAPPSETLACVHCGSTNVKPDGLLWLKCDDCNKGTKRG